MKFTSAMLAAICAISSPALGFQIPANQPDGVYEVSQNSDGKFNFIKLADPSAITSSGEPVTAITQRSSSRITGRCSGLCEIGCYGESILNRADTDAANADLDNQIGPNGHGLGSHLSVYSKRGNTVAYCCNNRSQGNTCYQSVHGQASQLITTKCGAYFPGYAYDSGAHLTYGYRYATDNFCPTS